MLIEFEKLAGRVLGRSSGAPRNSDLLRILAGQEVHGRLSGLKKKHFVKKTVSYN
jgi:hypothetical protein